MTVSDNFETAIGEMATVKDFFVNDKCSECGDCCGRYLALSNKEINQIRHYIKKHNIKRNLHSALVYRNPVYDLTCPFLDDTKNSHKCLIYEVRPLLCKEFTCRKYTQGYRGSKELYKEHRKTIDMVEMFFGSQEKLDFQIEVEP